ncbi:GFA family protein [Spartinivicinus poritis]|uniref:GFA family protein n=1 Tax=Spartinivicinus poritis TaxID=2994640 RepID=A0ABT5U7R9_9GAMM|nr:GFA family protein [Spartinivicinus sp. A2-2]MDE1462416.1 GFA family protein [Spartinivicinus sp. A2-2]
MYKGSCLCGVITYQLKSEPKKVTNCHCKMCQKQHGAAFATYGSVLKSDLVYLTGLDKLVSYNSSGLIARKFCSCCGSSIEWSGSKAFSEWVSIAIATLDTHYKPENIADIYTETKACWLVKQT